jgi:hypothetical protein
MLEMLSTVASLFVLLHNSNVLLLMLFWKNFVFFLIKRLLFAYVYTGYSMLHWICCLSVLSGRGKAYTLNAFAAFLVFHATLNSFLINLNLIKNLKIKNWRIFNIKVRPYRVEGAWCFSGSRPTGAAFEGYCI